MSRLSQIYGITNESYEEMLAEQGGGCAICGARRFNRISDRLAVDHNHNTGHPRGLLCGRCNLVLGMVRDSAEVLKNAIRYLEINLSRAESSPPDF